MTDLIPIRRELLERIDESAICDGTDATISDDLFTELVAALAAPVQGEAECRHCGGSGEVWGTPCGGCTTTPQPAEVRELVEALKWISRVNATDYEYQKVARAAIAKLVPQPNPKPKETP